MLWFNFTLALNFIFFCPKLIIIHDHPEQREIGFAPKIELNYNIIIYTYTVGCPYVLKCRYAGLGYAKFVDLFTTFKCNIIPKVQCANISYVLVIYMYTLFRQCFYQAF